MNKLNEINAERLEAATGLRDEIRARRLDSDAAAASYPWLKLRDEIGARLSERFGVEGLEAELKLIDRQRFGGDLAIKVPSLLKENGSRPYITESVPAIAETLLAMEHVFEDAQTKGIYVNVRFRTEWLLKSLQVPIDLELGFGIHDAMGERSFVVDYSSPNVAKVLHPGHIRSSIIGHVLGNLFQACGALVYRVNHINDFGGFGFMLEGYRRFEKQFPGELSQNDKLLLIYSIRRTLERAVSEGLGPADLSPEERALVERYFPEAGDAASLTTSFRAYVEASDRRFEALERGEAEEVELWKQMVDWSLEAFERFYRGLGIHIDFTLGESFYFAEGNALVERSLKDGRAVVADEAFVQAEVDAIERRAASEEITEAERESAIEAVRKDTGAVVVPLPDHTRLVVRRADGRSIYATRDLGAIALRREIFDPTDVVYVVGQEQKVHFERLFLAAEQLGLADGLALRHLYFGFYVDGKTKKKLSSRDSVSNVDLLMETAVEHFRALTAERADIPPEEVEVIARKLAVGSLVFNDLKQDMKGAVEIHTADLSVTVREFEKSGGAYVVYTACRARGILRKWGKPVPKVEEIGTGELSAQEAQLVLEVQRLPEQVAKAAAQMNPAILVRHLLDLSALYNNFYAKAPVLTREGPNLPRLVLTAAVANALMAGLRVCHVECPERI